MTLAARPNSLADQQHIVVDEISWEFYEQLLAEIGNRPVRVNYDQGRLEIMSPQPKDELWGAWINRLIELMCLERSIPVAMLGRDKPRVSVSPHDCIHGFHSPADGEGSA
jgi:hypothetical protein